QARQPRRRLPADRGVPARGAGRVSRWPVATCDPARAGWQDAVLAPDRGRHVPSGAGTIPLPHPDGSSRMHRRLSSLLLLLVLALVAAACGSGDDTDTGDTDTDAATEDAADTTDEAATDEAADAGATEPAEGAEGACDPE